MRKAISNDEATGSSLQQADPVAATYFDVLGIDRADLDWQLKRPTATTELKLKKAGDELTAEMRYKVKAELSVRRKIIARMAQEDLEKSRRETIEYAKQLQAALDARNTRTAVCELPESTAAIERGTL